MHRATPTLISDVITLALGGSEPLRSTQLDQTAIDATDFEKRCRRWVRSQNVLMLDVGPKIVGGAATETNALRVWVRSKVPRNILSRPVPHTLRHEAFPDVPTDVIAVDSSMPAATGRFPISPGRSCSRIGDARGTGTITCVGVSPDGSYGLTAGHVFVLSGENNPNIQVHGAGLNDTPGTSVVGRVSRRNILLRLGETNTLDVAAFNIKSTEVSRFRARPIGVGPVQGLRSQSSLSRGERVHVFGAASQRTMVGRVWAGNVRRPVYFSDGQNWYELVNFIDIRFAAGERPMPGDSGSLVVDMRGFGLGIYIGGAASSSRRYVVPLGLALDAMDITPVWN